MGIIIMGMVMSTDVAGAMRLVTWLSPAFPTGAFAYSHALEWAVEVGDITNPDQLQTWLADVLRLGSGRGDAILLRLAHRTCHDQAALAELASFAAAAAPSRERQAETLHQGAAFLLAAGAWQQQVMPPDIDVAYPVAVGALAGRSGIAEETTAAAYLQSLTSNFISAAVRLVPLGQTAGLRVLAALEPVILGLLDETRAVGLDDFGGACFRSDIASMRHETQYTRLFRT
jgi:urease accessory protein